MRLPPWWDWELEPTPHILKRMVDRGFTEVDLRAMLAGVGGVRVSGTEGRYVARCVLAGRCWEVVLEPLPEEEVVLVVTAYPVAMRGREKHG